MECKKMENKHIESKFIVKKHFDSTIVIKLQTDASPGPLFKIPLRKLQKPISVINFGSQARWS